jgi:hypothetical protein
MALVGDERIGAVEKIVAAGRYGPYVVVRDNELGTITFSLSQSVWNEDRWPDQGTFVVLSQIIRKHAGWRAMKGRFMKPSDEQSTESKAEKATSKKGERK